MTDFQSLFVIKNIICNFPYFAIYLSFCAQVVIREENQNATCAVKKSHPLLAVLSNLLFFTIKQRRFLRSFLRALIF